MSTASIDRGRITAREMGASPGAGDCIGKQSVVAVDDEGAYRSIGGIVVDVEPTVLTVAD